MKRLTALLGAILVCAIGFLSQAESRYSVPGGVPAKGAIMLPKELRPANSIAEQIKQGTVFDLPQYKATSAKAATSKMSLKSANIYGWLTYQKPYPTGYDGYGFCTTTIGGITKTFGFGVEQYGQYPGFFIRDGKVCTYVLYEVDDQVRDYAYHEYDMNTGDLITDRQIPLLGLHTMFKALCYCPDNDMVYGYSYGNETGLGNNITFIKVDPKDPTNIRVVKEVNAGESCSSITWNQDEKILVGINQTNMWCEIDPLTGDQTPIKKLEGCGRYPIPSGLCWDPVDKMYLWEICYYDATESVHEDNSYLIGINPAENYSVSRLLQYPKKERFAGFFCPDHEQAADDAPQDAVIKEFNFPAGSLSGSIVYTMPTLFGDGSPIVGNVQYLLMLDEEDYKMGTVPAGGEVTINFSELSEGNHTFRIQVSYKGIQGRSYKEIRYIGHDTPKAPKNVVMKDEHITWDPVTEGVHAGYIDPAQVIYNVYVNNRLAGRNLKTAYFDYKFEDDAEFAEYIVEVEAEYNGKVSDPSDKASCLYGKPFNIPAYFEPAENQDNLFTVINANNDAETWYTYAHDDGRRYFINITWGTAPADDWLILPAVLFPSATNVYEFSFEAATYRDGSAERFEVYIGDEPTVAAMKQQLMPTTTLSSKYYVQYKTTFSITNPGAKYIAIRSISPAGSFRTYVREFKVSNAAISQEAPDAPQDCVISYGDNGALNAKVSFKMPTTTISGKALDTNTDLTATVTCTTNGNVKTLTGKPGQAFNTTVPAAQGSNYVVVEVSNASGTGRPISSNIYCGLDIPMTVNDFQIYPSTDNLNVEMSWTAPTEGMHGGYVSPKGINYYLAQYNEDSGGFEVSSLIGTDKYSVKLNLPEYNPQVMGMFGVVAANSAGQSTKVAGGSVIIGRPYTLPMREEYTKGSVEYTPFFLYQPTEEYSTKTIWNVRTPGVIDAKYALGDGQYALVGRTTNAKDKARFNIPKFSSKGAANPSFYLTTYIGSCDEIEVFASRYGLAEPVSLGKVSQKTTLRGYQTVEFELPSNFKNQDWVELFIDVTFGNSDQICIIPSYIIKDAVAQDLGVLSISGTESALIDNEASYSAVVSNEGFEAMAFSGAKWTLTDKSGKVIKSADVAAAGTMQPGDTKEFKFSFTPDANMAGELTLTFALNGSDLNNLNDSKSLTINVSNGAALVVTDLRAVESDGSSYVDLEWTAPYFGSGSESFEDIKPFNNEAEYIGVFRNIDGDKAAVYGINNIDYEFNGMPAGWTVWNPSQLGVESRYPTYDGKQFIMAVSPDVSKSDVAADDWLISPAIAGGTEVAFAIRAITYQYGAETVEVMYSTTDREPSSFKVAETITLSGSSTGNPDWVEKVVNLPDDAVYFAIHYVSKDRMGVMIDKLEWTPLFYGLNIAGYDIYRDNQLLEEKAKATTRYRDATIADAKKAYSYHIVPVLSNNQRGQKSNVVTVAASGVDELAAGKYVMAGKGTITVAGYEGAKVIIFAADGKTVVAEKNAPAKAVYNVEAGVYMVIANGITHKVIVL